MRQLLKSTASAAALILGTGLGAAQAADLPMAVPIEPIIAPVAFNWTGFYVGVHGGAIWADRHRRKLDLCEDRTLQKADVLDHADPITVTPDTSADAVDLDLTAGTDEIYPFELRLNTEETGVTYCEIDEEGFDFNDEANGFDLFDWLVNEGVDPEDLGSGRDFLVLRDQGLFHDDDDDHDVNFLVGGQVGFNWQVAGSPWVFGLEADGSVILDDEDEEKFRTEYSVYDAIIPEGLISGIFENFENDVNEERGAQDPPLGPVNIYRGLTDQPANSTLALEEVEGTIEADTRRMEWLATARGRIGYAWDRFMLYGTGGVAFTEFSGGRLTVTETRYDEFNTVTGDNCAASDFAVNATCGDTAQLLYDLDTAEITRAGGTTTVTHYGKDDEDVTIGFAVGAGGEFALTDRLSLAVQYLYVNFDEDDEVETITVADRELKLKTEGDFDAHSITGRLNFRVGGFAAPAVAPEVTTRY